MPSPADCRVTPERGERHAGDFGVTSLVAVQSLLTAAVVVSAKPATGAASVVSSPYRRAHDTIAPAAAALGIAITMRDDAREWDDGFETADDWRPRYEACWRDLDLRYGDGESHRDLMVRAGACLRELLDRAGDGTIVVASHGTWISRGLQALGAPVTLAFWEAMPLPAVFELQADGGAIEMTGPGLP